MKSIKSLGLGLAAAVLLAAGFVVLLRGAGGEQTNEVTIYQACLLYTSYRILFEEGEKRRVKSVFSKIVSPDVVNELLGAEKLSLGGARCEVTVFFADVRGFTTLTDEMQQQVADFIREKNLDPDAAEKCIDESARETLETVNLYLAAVADAVDVYKRQGQGHPLLHARSDLRDA